MQVDSTHTLFSEMIPLVDVLSSASICSSATCVVLRGVCDDALDETCCHVDPCELAACQLLLLVGVEDDRVRGSLGSVLGLLCCLFGP